MTAPQSRIVESAVPDDVVALHRSRRQVEEWLHGRGIRQWPRGEMSQEDIAVQVSRREWRVVRSPDAGVVAAMRVLWSDPEFWGEDDTPAMYVHGLMVDRAVAGRRMGVFMLDKAAEAGRDRGRGVLRLDCAESNRKLRSFYREQDFREVGRREFRDLFSVTLFERAI